MTPTPNPAFRRIIRMRAEPVPTKRRDTGASADYGTGPTYSALANDREVFIWGVQESQNPTGAGEQQSMRLTAYAVDTIDLRVNDRIQHGGEWFEVLSKEGKPNEMDTAVYRYELDNV